MLIWTLVIAITLFTYYFSVRITLLECLSFDYKNGKLDKGDWAFCTIFPLICPPLVFLGVCFMSSKHIRAAFFLPPRPKKPRREHYPYVRHALGKIFKIGN